MTPDQGCLLSKIGTYQIDGTAKSYNTFECTKCKNQGVEYVLQQDPEKSQLFVDFEAIANCEHYDTTDILSTSTLKCVRCVNDEINYLTTTGDIQQCKVRTQSIGDLLTSSCETFAPDSDNCLTCKPMHYLIVEATTSLKRCKKNPLNCKVYFYQASPLVEYCTACVDEFEMVLIDSVHTCVKA